MIKCGICNDLFFSRVDCIAHINNEHEHTEEDPCFEVAYHCPKCSEIFQHIRDCTNHAMREHGLQKIDCREITP